MCKASAVDDAAGPNYSERDSIVTNTRTIDNTDRSEGVKNKVDIIMPDKTNKTLILVSYQLNI